MSNATNIVAYTFQAANYCPDCIRDAVKSRYPLDYPLADSIGPFDTTEDILGTVAKSLNLCGNRPAGTFDRYDEHSFDSGEFPKVVFGSQVDEPETCETCGEEFG